MCQFVAPVGIRALRFDSLQRKINPAANDDESGASGGKSKTMTHRDVDGSRASREDSWVKCCVLARSFAARAL